MRENYSSITASEKLLACLGEDGQLKGLFWPFKDSRHSHLEFAICGFAINGESIWLDPARDQLQIQFCPNEKVIISSWEVKHPKFFGAIVKKKTLAMHESVVEKWELIVPKELSSSKINLWLLSSWNICSEKRFQSVYTETGEDMIFAYSKDIWVGIGACNGSFYSHFQAVRAIQSSAFSTLGEIVEHFLQEPNKFRRIEMGNVYATACTQPFIFTKLNDNFFEGKVTIFYGFGKNQEELEYKLSLYFDNNALEKEVNETIEKLKRNTDIKLKNFSFNDKRSYLKSISIYVLKSLTDHISGGIIAAPECDPDFKHSGGYGFVWPRDAAFCALSLIKCKQFELAKNILLFLAKIQNHHSDYFQRYDIQGNKAPSWCELQADQLGLVICAALEYLKYENNSQLHELVKKGTQKLIHDFSEKGSLQNSFDLWEECYGLHFYAHTAAYSALARSTLLLPELAEQIQQSLKICKNFCYHYLYVSKQKRFARTVDPHNNRDLQADISLLSCIFPFHDFPIEDDIKFSIFEFCYDKLTTKAGTLRYENDHYMGGNSWVLAGFWMSLAASELTKLQPSMQELAEEIFKKSIALCNEAGFFPEQVDSITGKPIWIVPLAWSHAFYLWANETFNLIKD
ncbi:glycoside hydrolase family 15 protein [Pigmentibacter ruber]|uniref:glycoside hydrolase family 15 protein n=1 Tax=Pigmentibacter ruber TaxID=2683196 RepID=UPI00131EAD6C|nr:glycoside hydrolase family 15 protein [Pigmentibacter ruber]BFD31949.1 glucan 1,4-alpha-glucosidase [Pigmentibacter ruber]